jgi:hypothetical protein
MDKDPGAVALGKKRAENLRKKLGSRARNSHSPAIPSPLVDEGSSWYTENSDAPGLPLYVLIRELKPRSSATPPFALQR